MTKKQSGFGHIAFLLATVVIIVIGVAGSTVFKKQFGYSPVHLVSGKTSEDKLISSGKSYSNGKCSGTGIAKLDHLPIAAQDITNVLPYGGVVGAHIMPISHAYIWPGGMNDPRDKYNVSAMADSTLYGISSRSINVDTNQPKKTEYQLQFSVSCAEFYYYDLLTSLSSDLQKIYDAHPSKDPRGNNVAVNIRVKSGQLVGKIGAQTLDYAVWDFNKTLTGYVVPSHYDGDFPRIHLVSPFDYETDSVKQVMLSKLVRSAEPRAGKVDYDIDGKLLGGWFQDGSGGYGGKTGQGAFRYWAGHLAIIPDYIDPTMNVISIGTFSPGKEAQFSLARSAPNPTTVGVDSGLVKYDLFNSSYILPDGTQWDRITPMTGLVGITQQPSQGCALLQLTQARNLKAEFVSGKTCASVGGFSAEAKLFSR